jgi:Mg-chelatase subunit ChlD
MAANIANAQQQNVKSNFTIGVITDGEDNQGGVDPLEIKNIIQELHQKNILRASVIIGLTSSEFDSNMLEELKNRLGFQSAISVSLDPKEIRRAFVLASQSAQSGQV